jgi:tetratricopeptide (TPR) repeat protein
LLGLCIVVAFAALAPAETLRSCAEGRELFTRQQWAPAQERLWECVANGAPGREHAYQLTLTYRELKNYEHGFSSLRKISAVTVDRLYLEGFLLFRTSAHRQSVEVLGRAHRLDPGDWRLHQMFALNYVVMEIQEGAEQEFQAAVSLNPDNAELWYQLARFLYTQNRFPESLAASEKALSLWPGYADAHNNLALCFDALAQPAKVREHYEKAIELNRRTSRADEWPLLNYAAFLIKEERIEDSLAMLERALDINVRSARAYYLRGKALRKLDRLTDARQALSRSIELDPNEPGAYYELGGVLRKTGDIAASRRMFEKFDSVRKKTVVSSIVH